MALEAYTHKLAGKIPRSWLANGYLTVQSLMSYCFLIQQPRLGQLSASYSYRCIEPFCSGSLQPSLTLSQCAACLVSVQVSLIIYEFNEPEGDDTTVRTYGVRVRPSHQGQGLHPEKYPPIRDLFLSEYPRVQRDISIHLVNEFSLRIMNASTVLCRYVSRLTQKLLYYYCFFFHPVKRLAISQRFLEISDSVLHLFAHKRRSTI